MVTARVASRGDVTSVLALPGFAERGEMLVHNHPSGVLEPSEADMQVAAAREPDTTAARRKLRPAAIANPSAITTVSE